MADDEQYISDESSFYGDDDEKQRLEDQLDDMIEMYRAHQKPSITSLALRNLATEAKNGPKATKLHNPYEGDKNARQLGESVNAFLKRIPPASTSKVEYGPWLWCANPFANYRDTDPKLAAYKQEALRILDGLSAKRAELNESMQGKAASTITRAYNPFKIEAESALARCAKKYNVLTGKWMLFPTTEYVNDAWREVVEGTIVGDLGVGAKVATDDGGDPRKGRLICIYTKDFTDVDDITRVIKALNDRGLGKGDRGIYYKCDAYTHLDIMGGNEWGIRASLYGSRELLKLDRVS